MAKNRYNIDEIKRMEHQVRSLEETSHNREVELNRLHNEKDNTESIVRDFCENILSGSRTEISDKNSMQWRKLSIAQLLLRTSAALNEAKEEWAAKLKTVLAENERRRIMLTEMQEKLDTAEQGAPEPACRTDVPETLAQAVKDNPNVRFVTEEEGDAFDDFQGPLNDMARTGKKCAVTPTDIVTKKNKGTVDQKEKAKENAQNSKNWKKTGLDQNELGELDELQRLMIDVMGDTGISVFTELSEAVIKKCEEKEIKCGDKKVRNEFSKLLSHKYIYSEIVKTWEHQRPGTIYWLTNKGKKAYHNRNGRDPEVQEAERILAEHSSYLHGYSIKYIADEMRSTSFYRTVNEFNRSNREAQDKGKYYVADIVCTDMKNRTMYIEFELNTCDQKYFEEKCNKMCTAARHADGTVNFIVANGKGCEEMLERIDKWLSGKDCNNLKGITVRVTTAGAVSGADLTENKGWNYIIIPFKSVKPVNMFGA